MIENLVYDSLTSQTLTQILMKQIDGIEFGRFQNLGNLDCGYAIAYKI